MKTKILFVMNSMLCGGAEKALISLLQTLDYSRYDVDLYLFKHEGIFMSKIPKEANLLDEPNKYKYFDMPFKPAIIDCFKKGEIATVLARIRLSHTIRIEKNKARCEQRVWKYISKSIKKVDKEYDAAIGFLEKNPIYFVVDKVKAKKKLGWIHSNYTNFGMDENIDKPYFEKLNHIVTVSDECAKSLHDHFQDQQDKVKVIHNIVSPKIINRLADSKTQADIYFDKEYINILTNARLSYVKGIDFAIKSCKSLLQDGYKIRWHVLGFATDIEKSECMSLIEYNGLEKSFKLLGVTDNPYPFIKYADICVQPSRSEGKSIAIDEAKILHKPIVITNFSTAKDQIDNEQNGLIVDMNPEAIAEGIKRIINDAELRNKLTTQLSSEELGTESEIEKLYQLIN